MRYESKEALVDDIRREHDALCSLLREMSPSRFREPGVWGDGWTLNDLVAHLAEWQRMFLSWHSDGLAGRTPQMPAAGYTWRETPRLNRAIQAKHSSRSVNAVRADFDSGYRQVLQLVEALSPDSLLRPGHFAWTGQYPLTTYLGPNTASHYRFAIKVIRRWLSRQSDERRTFGSRSRGAGAALTALLALGLAVPTRGEAQSALERRKLTAVAVVDGITCGPTGRAYAHFYPSGRLAECPLAADTALFGQTLPARTWIELSVDGRLWRAWLPHDVPLSGHQCKGRGYKEWSVVFHPSGALALCYLPNDTVIEGVPCLRGTIWNELRGGGKSAVRFHENGRLQSCQAARTFSRNGRPVKKWQLVQLEPE